MTDHAISTNDHLVRLFEDEGVAASAIGNQPLVLDDPESVWLVTGAPAHLFVVEVRNGVVTGSRLPLIRVNPGAILFGAEALEIDGVSWSIMAAGLPDTLLHKLPLDRIDGSGGDVEAAALWLESLERGIRPAYPPQTAVNLLPELDEIELETGQAALAFTQSVWLSVSSGSTTLFGLPGLTVGPDDGPIRLANEAWLVAAEPAVLTVSNAPSSPDVRRALATLGRLAISGIVARARARDIEARDRLIREVSADRDTTNRALRQILGVFEPDEQPIELDAVDANDPLLAACKVVGHHAGVEVKAPPESAAGAADPLRAIARASRFRTRQVMLDGEWWKQDSGPLLAYVEADQAPVALTPRQKGGYDAFDAATGVAREVDRALARSLSPFAQQFYRPFPDRAIDAWSLLRFGFRGGTRDALAVVVLGLLSGVLGLAAPIATGRLIDDIIPHSNRAALLEISLALVASALAVAAFTITRNIALLRLEGRSDLATQAAMWDRLLALPVPFFKDYTAGDLGTRALGIDRIRRALSDVAVTAILAFIFATPSFVLQVFIDIRLALVSGLLLALLLAAVTWSTNRQLAIQRGMLDVGGRLSGLVLQLLNGLPKLRVAGAEQRAFSVWARSYSQQSELAKKNQLLLVQLAVLYAVYPAVSTLVLYGIYATQDWASVSTGQFLSFNTAFGQILGATIGMATAIGTLTMILPTYERLKPILQSLPETDELKADPGRLRGEIEVSGVTFSYREGDPPTLTDVSFHVRPGEFVAFVGPSGAGKSTLLRLLLGFDRPDSGSVLYDGQDLDKLDLQSVRRQLGVVLQNGSVMPGELGQNIIGSTNLTLDDAWEAARMAGFDEDIRKMPMGMHTYIMEGGTTLSGGQRQRLMIARALVNRPRILLFDEATSALDNRTQEIVSRSLEQLSSTRIVIAHRLSTIIQADTIHVMVAGRIVQSGSYDELMAVPDGPFYQLAKRQLI